MCKQTPLYPQRNGNFERCHGSLKDECIRFGFPATKEEAENRELCGLLRYDSSSQCDWLHTHLIA